jgi:DeoR/GlpR family transcriptional regulator of sugar metabolism
VVVLADYTKIGEETMCQTVPAARVHTLITDSRAPATELEAIRAAGLEVRVAEVAHHVESKRATA